MTKRIPKTLKKTLLKTLYASTEPLPSNAIADRVNNDPNVPYGMKKSPKQIAYIVGVLTREYPEIFDIKLLSKNGTNHHGNERFKKEFTVKRAMTLADAEKAMGVTNKGKKTQVTVMLSEKSVGYIKAHRNNGLSAGQVVEELITKDIDNNGMPSTE
tara:strand:+ start:3259 stop:3729 length:471 start_codon:yes stop_codon:yes gene_type:complete